MKKNILFVLMLCGMLNAADGTAECVRDNEKNTVTCSDTNLMWQDEISSSTYSRVKAIKYCEDLEFAGFTDWRLPNVNEAISIVDFSKTPDSENALFKDGFKKIIPDGSGYDVIFMTSTLGNNKVITIDYSFYDDYLEIYSPLNETTPVRCVRNATK